MVDLKLVYDDPHERDKEINPTLFILIIYLSTIILICVIICFVAKLRKKKILETDVKPDKEIVKII